MIAANYRKFPEALALQRVLPWGHALVWHVRPSTRWGRAMRALRGRLAAAVGRIVYPVKPVYCARPKETRRMCQASIFVPGWKPKGSILQRIWSVGEAPTWPRLTRRGAYVFD